VDSFDSHGVVAAATLKKNFNFCSRETTRLQRYALPAVLRTALQAGQHCGQVGSRDWPKTSA
jgi:hypothetical protein